MQLHRHAITGIAVAACVALAFSTVHAQQTAGARGLTYESLRDLPPLAGMWGGGPGGGRGVEPAAPARGGPPNAAQLLADVPPLRNQQILARYREAIKLLVSGADNVALAAKYGDVLGGRGGGGREWRNLGGGLCDPYGGAGGFSGRTGGGPESVMEVLFTPGRVTITTDHGLLRRIYTDGRPVPTDPFVTLTGTSVGRWEGDTLLVETVGLSPTTVLFGVQAGEGFKIDERMYLDEGGRLHIDGTITAPDAFTGPYSYTQTYARVQNSSHMLGQFVTECDKVDRSIDRTTNQQRFDLTPPPNLPPPPSN